MSFIRFFTKPSVVLFALLTLLLGSGSLVGCSSGKSKGSDKSSTREYRAPTWVQGVFEDSFQYYQICENPRTGIDPFTNEPYFDEQGTVMHEKMFARSVMHEAYLWYEGILDVNPSLFSLETYFYDYLVVTEDEFSFIAPYEDFFEQSQSGTSMDYGVIWQANASRTKIFVAYVEPNSINSGLIERGDELVLADGVSFSVAKESESQWDIFFNALYPSTPAAENTFSVIKKATGQEVDVVLKAADVIYLAVPEVTTIATEDGLVGYMLFNSHTAIAQDALFEAFNNLKAQNINDLVVDLRFNSGGRLSAASQLAYMVAGPEQTEDKIFFRKFFNNKSGSTNPITGLENTPTPFLTQLLDEPSGEPSNVTLPSLDLPRVYVLTSDYTCSASETFINGLIGVGVEVYQFGGTTCGKPYGYLPIENCGKVYNFMMFSEVNDKGDGFYANGFRPDNNLSTIDFDYLPGCRVSDDFQTELGSEFESLLSTALHYRATGSCDASSNAVQPASAGFELLTPMGESVLPSRAVQKKMLQKNLLRNSRSVLPVKPVKLSRKP